MFSFNFKNSNQNTPYTSVDATSALVCYVEEIATDLKQFALILDEVEKRADAYLTANEFRAAHGLKIDLHELEIALAIGSNLCFEGPTNPLAIQYFEMTDTSGLPNRLVRSQILLRAAKLYRLNGNSDTAEQVLSLVEQEVDACIAEQCESQAFTSLGSIQAKLATEWSILGHATNAKKSLRLEDTYESGSLCEKHTRACDKVDSLITFAEHFESGSTERWRLLTQAMDIMPDLNCPKYEVLKIVDMLQQSEEPAAALFMCERALELDFFQSDSHIAIASLAILYSTMGEQLKSEACINTAEEMVLDLPHDVGLLGGPYHKINSICTVASSAVDAESPEKAAHVLGHLKNGRGSFGIASMHACGVLRDLLTYHIQHDNTEASLEQIKELAKYSSISPCCELFHACRRVGLHDGVVKVGAKFWRKNRLAFMPEIAKAEVKLGRPSDAHKRLSSDYPKALYKHRRDDWQKFLVAKDVVGALTSARSDEAFS